MPRLDDTRPRRLDRVYDAAARGRPGDNNLRGWLDDIPVDHRADVEERFRAIAFALADAPLWKVRLLLELADELIDQSSAATAQAVTSALAPSPEPPSTKTVNR